MPFDNLTLPPDVVKKLIDPKTGKPDPAKIKKFADKLNAGERRDLYKGLKEADRRSREEKARYYKPTDEQLPFHKSKARFRIEHGGNRSGKTVSGAEEAHWWLSGTHPYLETPLPPVRGRICGTSWSQVGKVTLRKLKETIPRHYLRGGTWDSAFVGNLSDLEESATLHYKNGSTVEFMCGTQKRQHFAGTDMDFIWEDEELPYELHEENMQRLLDRAGSFWLTLTPVEGMTWVYDEFVARAAGDKEIELFQLHTENNPHISKEAVEYNKRKYASDPDTLAVLLHGDFIQVGGMVLKILNQNIHLIDDFPINEHHPEWLRCVAIDPAPSKSHAALWMAIDRNKTVFGKHPIYVYDELLFDSGMPIDQFCDEVKRKSSGQFINYWPFDPHWNWENKALNGKNIFKEFKRYLPVYGGQENKGEIYYEEIKKRLLWDKLSGQAGIYFFKEGARLAFDQCRRLSRVKMRDIQTRQSDEPPVRKVNDDLVDCLGLGLTDAFAYNPGFMKMQETSYVRDPLTGRILA